MIRKVERADITECVRVIRESFRTVADEFGFTKENAPRFTAFAMTEEWLLWQMEGEHRLMFADVEDGIICASGNRGETAETCDGYGQGTALQSDQPGHCGRKHCIAAMV